MRRVLACALVLSALAAPSAWARDPITPLSDVHRGLDCTALTVVQGTEIASFDAQVLDVVADADGTGPRILVHVSGPAVAASGLAEGFSGSPVYCPDAHGAIGNAGAISATIGQYGEDVGLVTPIEQMLNLPVKPPIGVRRAPKLLREARPLAAPLVISGLSPALGGLLERTALAHGHVLIAAPAGPLGTFPPQPLVPGASLAVDLSTGAVSAGAIGTVTYRDGDVVYGFGHPFEGAGRRALLLGDAYVYTVVANPLDTPTAVSYKLAAPGHVLGTLTNDALTGVVGSVGPAPGTVPLTVRVHDRDSGATVQQQTNLVDEVDLGDPDGQDALSGLASLAVAQAITSTLDGAPAQETGRLCLTVHLRELPRALRFCKRYVAQGSLQDGVPSPLALTMGFDTMGALGLIDNARFRALHPTAIEASATVERGLRLATIQSADLARRKVRPGERVRVAMRVRLYRGPLRTVHFALRVPRDVSPGLHLLRLVGAPADDVSLPGSGALALLLSLFGDIQRNEASDSLAELVARFDGGGGYDGVRAVLDGTIKRVFRSRAVRVDGRALVPIVIARPKHRGHGKPRAIGRILDARR